MELVQVYRIIIKLQEVHIFHCTELSEVFCSVLFSLLRLVVSCSWKLGWFIYGLCCFVVSLFCECCMRHVGCGSLMWVVLVGWGMLCCFCCCLLLFALILCVVHVVVYMLVMVFFAWLSLWLTLRKYGFFVCVTSQVHPYFLF